MSLALSGVPGEACHRKLARLKQLTDGQVFIPQQQVESLERCILGREESWAPWCMKTEDCGRRQKEYERGGEDDVD